MAKLNLGGPRWQEKNPRGTGATIFCCRKPMSPIILLFCQESPENLELMRAIDKEYTDHPFYGSRQMRNVLRRQGYKINRKRVQRLMRRMGLQSVAPKPGTSKPHPGHKVYPYLLRNLVIDYPDQVRCTDITYIRMSGGIVTNPVISYE